MFDPGNRAEAPADHAGLFRFLATPKRFLVFILAYFALQFGIRVILDGSANLDESEQLYLGQTFSLGYGAQPPLYTWLQAAVFAAIGPSILALASLKNALLCCSYWLAYLNGRMIAGRHSAGVVAALSLLFIPQIAWESQRDLTHSVLASTLALATLFTFLKASSTGRWSWFLLLGAAMGAGTLAKYNYGLWALGLIGAALLMPEFRVHTLSRGMVLALVLAAVIVLPHAVWMTSHSDRVLASSSKLALVNSGNWFKIRAEGVGNLLMAAGAFILPWLAIYTAFLLWKRARATEAVKFAAEVRLVGRALLIIAAVLFLAILVFGATGFKDRWFQPILICLPVVMAPKLTESLPPIGLRWWQRLALVVMLVISILIPGKVVFAARVGREERLNYPYAQLAHQMKPWVKRDTVLIADTMLLAGNLRLAFPDNDVQWMSPAAPSSREWILVWDARRRATPPGRMSSWVEGAEQEKKILEAPYRFQPDKIFRMGMVRPSGPGGSL